MNYLYHYLETNSSKYPQKTAIICGEDAITFSDLEHRSKTLACEIKKRRVRKKPVFVYLDKGIDTIVAFMGILCSANFYTPTDVNFPVEKPRRIYETLSPSLTVTSSKYIEKCKEIGIPENRLIIIDQLDYTQDTKNFCAVPTTTEDLAYVLFTSGSTGLPKGVTITRGAVMDYIQWVQKSFGIKEKDSICNQAPFYFDNSTLDVYTMLSTGATLHIVPESYYAFPANLVRYIDEKQITTIFWVPSVFQTFQKYDLFSKHTCASLSKILFAGEVMHNKELNYWRKHIPNALYANLYGPTEITVDCTCYIVDREFEDDEPLPIGKARDNMDVFLLDSADKEITTTDVQGEICVAGYSLSKGYWNDKEKTKKVFVQNPFHTDFEQKIYRTGDIGHYNTQGEIMFDGRLDNQIKHNGYRIELGELEDMAMGVPYIQQICAVFDSNKNIINIFSVVEGDRTERQIMIDLRTVLPNYMMPGKIHILDDMPLNDNGKYDRKKLKEIIERG